MSARNRARRKAGLRYVRTQAGVDKYDQPINSVIVPDGPRKQKPKAITLAEAREQVADILKGFNPRKLEPGESAEDREREMQSNLTRLMKRHKAAPTTTLRAYEKVLTDVVENEVDERGHHTSIPAFQGFKKQAAEELLLNIRGTLAERPSERLTTAGGKANPFLTEAGRGQKRIRERVANSPEVLATKATSNRSPKRPEPGTPKDQAFQDRQRRLQWEAWRKSVEDSLKSAPPATPWARDAIEDMNATISVPDKVHSGDGGKLKANPKAEASRVARIKLHVAEVARKQGINEMEAYRQLIVARGGLTPGMQKALFIAAGVQPPEKQTPKWQEAKNLPSSPARPEPERVKLRALKSLPTMSDEDLSAYRDQMAAHMKSRTLRAEQKQKAQAALQAATAELNRRKGSGRHQLPKKARDADLSDQDFVKAVRQAGDVLLDADAKAREDLRRRRRKRGSIHHEGTDPRTGQTATSRKRK